MSRQTVYRCDCCMASSTERLHLGWLVHDGKDYCQRCHVCALGYGRQCKPATRWPSEAGVCGDCQRSHA